ncbi:hypothetical protein BJ978_000625 [Agromyces terreus]|uniref:Transcriptional regulator, AbiEi antitoxin, Type IV TA system n=1 Tax=Agromyces terreus TaxID=424795 RepID=A0A9X2H4L1_9MICO|nr:hypothetical protein [Agromyces terreus]MCP2369949.1 hypothetical protein [Agromyces terreus]
MPQRLPLDPHGLVHFADVRAQGRHSELRAAVANGDLVQIRRGVYRDASKAPIGTGPAPSPAERRRIEYLAATHAVARTFSAPVFTSYSAAVLHGLPIIGPWPAEVYILARGPHGRRRAGVVEVARTKPVECLEIDGCLTTSVEFSLLQLARHAPLIAALTATDAALHIPRITARTPHTTPDRLAAEHIRLKPYAGSRRAEAVLSRATPLADSPLETGSRILIEELGFSEPQLQHELWLPELGRPAFLDFFWPEVGVGVEVDGRGKYRAGSRSADGTAVGRAVDAVISEKDRENAIRRQVAGFDRWDWNDMLARAPVEERLLRLGVPRTRRRRYLT